MIAHRIVLTENCNASCGHCFNADVRNKNDMDADIFIKFMRDNSEDLEYSSLKIMGGEPTLHPRVSEIIKEALKHYLTVSLFTNGINIKNIIKKFGSRISYTINGYTFNPAMMDDWKHIVLHFVITKNDSDKVIEKMLKCMDSHPNSIFLYSPDTQINIFEEEFNEYRETWMNATKIIIPELNRRKIRWNLDHNFPLCFFTKEMESELEAMELNSKIFTSCGCNETGLIDANFDLYFCNQTRIKLGSILNKSIPEINQMIEGSRDIKISNIKQLNKKCRYCEFINNCAMGCYYNGGR